MLDLEGTSCLLSFCSLPVLCRAFVFCLYKNSLWISISCISAFCRREIKPQKDGVTEILPMLKGGVCLLY